MMHRACSWLTFRLHGVRAGPSEPSDHPQRARIRVSRWRGTHTLSTSSQTLPPLTDWADPVLKLEHCSGMSRDLAGV